MENLNRVLLENVLPAHVAEHFLARNWKNEVGIHYVSFDNSYEETHSFCFDQQTWDGYTVVSKRFWSTCG